MGHLDLIADADALIAGQRLTRVKIQPANGVADGRDSIELSREEWARLRGLARRCGVELGDGNFTLSREEGCRLAHALRLAGTPDATTRRILIVLGKNGGLMVTGGTGA